MLLVHLHQLARPLGSSAVQNTWLHRPDMAYRLEVEHPLTKDMFVHSEPQGESMQEALPCGNVIYCTISICVYTCTWLLHSKPC